MPICRFCKKEFKFKRRQDGARKTCYEDPCIEKNQEYLKECRKITRRAHYNRFSRPKFEPIPTGRHCLACGCDPKPNMFYCPGCHVGVDDTGTNPELAYGGIA